MLNKKVKLSKSNIPWTDYSWGVVDGCTKVSEACQNCYAEAMVTRFQPDRKFSDVRTHPERLEAPLNTKKGGKVFVAPLGDLFHESVPFEFVDQVFAVMALCHQHTFQVLTKRPERMLEWFNYKDMAWRHESMRGDERIRFQTYHTFGQTVPSESWQWPLPNLWLGVTVENNKHLHRIDDLLQCPAAVRFVSIEPMLGPVDLTEVVYRKDGASFGNYLSWLDLVICGGESGPKARPMHPDWARSLRDQCLAAGVKFYFKQWGEWAPYPWTTEANASQELCLSKNGDSVFAQVGHMCGMRGPDDALMLKVGTKKSGCLLDGVEYKQMPEVNQ